MWVACHRRLPGLEVVWIEGRKEGNDQRKSKTRDDDVLQRASERVIDWTGLDRTDGTFVLIYSDSRRPHPLPLDFVSDGRAQSWFSYKLHPGSF